MKKLLFLTKLNKSVLNRLKYSLMNDKKALKIFCPRLKTVLIPLSKQVFASCITICASF